MIVQWASVTAHAHCAIVYVYVSCRVFCLYNGTPWVPPAFALRTLDWLSFTPPSPSLLSRTQYPSCRGVNLVSLTLPLYLFFLYIYSQSFPTYPWIHPCPAILNMYSLSLHILPSISFTSWILFPENSSSPIISASSLPLFPSRSILLFPSNFWHLRRKCPKSSTPIPHIPHVVSPPPCLFLVLQMHFPSLKMHFPSQNIYFPGLNMHLLG